MNIVSTLNTNKCPLNIEVKLKADLGLSVFRSDLVITGESGKIIIELNENHPTIKKAFQTPVNGLVLAEIQATAIATEIANSDEDLEALMPDLISSYGIDATDKRLVFMAVFSELMATMDVVTEPTIK